MAVNIRSTSRLAGVLLGDAEQIAERAAARIQERLPSYTSVSREDLIPVLLADTRHLLEAIRDTDVDRGCAEIDDRAWAETRARQGVTSDELLQGWRVGLEVVCEAAHARSEELGIGDCVLLEFVEATLLWGDVGLRALVSAHREVEIGELDRLAEEQAALRRVATLVARGAPAEELFAAVVEEAGRVFPADIVSLSRRDSDDTITVAAVSGGLADSFPVGLVGNYS